MVYLFHQPKHVANVEVFGPRGRCVVDQDGKSAIARARELLPELIMLDLLMPGMDGVSAIRSLRTVSPTSKVVILTSCEDDDLAFAAIEAGAHGLLLKSMSGTELLSAIQRIVGDEVVIHPEVTQRILKTVRTIRHPENNLFSQLSDREIDILRALADGARMQSLPRCFPSASKP